MISYHVISHYKILYLTKSILVQTAQASNLYYMLAQERLIFYCSAVAPYYLEPECGACAQRPEQVGYDHVGMRSSGLNPHDLILY